jgi:hypothetical protein
LLIVIWKHWEYKDEYCSHDVSWRSSLACKIAGAISYAASHGSLLVVVATSFCRQYHCRNTLGETGFKLSRFIFSFVLMNIFNLTMAAAPLIATLVQSDWAEIFVYEFFFKNNPLIRRGRKDDLAFLISQYKRVDLKIVKQSSISDLLRNMTSKGELFSQRKVASIGLYGSSSLCYPDLFSSEPTIFFYKVAYMIENSIYLSVIIICYCLIVKKFMRSRAAVGSFNLF